MTSAQRTDAAAPGFSRYLNIRSTASPCFSHDGRTLFFLTDITGIMQVWSVALAGGWPRQQSFFPDRVQTVSASRQADRALCGTDHGGNERQQLYLIEHDGTVIRPLAVDPRIIHHPGDWSPDGGQISFAANRRHEAFFDVWVQDVQSGEAHAVFTDDSNTYPGAWSPDGTKLLFSRDQSSAENSLFLLDIATGEATELTPHEGDARYEQPAWHPDGRLFLLSDEGRNSMALCTLAIGDGGRSTLEAVVAPQHDIDGMAVSQTGEQLAYTVNEDGYSRLVVRDVATGREQSPQGLPPAQVSEPAWSPDGSQLAFVVSGPCNPSEIYVWRLTETTPRRMTFSGRGGIAEATFVSPEYVCYPTFDGRSIPAYLYRPGGTTAGGLPVVVHLHGGPESQARPAFNAVFQFLLSRGLGLLVPNVRGSTGYGKAYSHLDDVQLRMDSVRDLESAVDWLVERGVADPRRIAVMGASYGGFMTLAAVTSYPGLWAAAVDIVGLANFETFFEQTSVWRRDHRAREYGDPERDRDFLRSISPIHQVDRIVAPMIVIHGRNDPRVPIGESEQIVRTVRERGGVADYLVFDDEGHGVVKLPNRIHAYEAIAAFLERHLLGA